MNDTLQTLIVVRHGETRFNVEERFQGHNDSPLTSNGQRQVQALGRRIRALGFDRLISSDLGRALQTADAIAAGTGIEIEIDARLRERHYGVLEGLSLEEIKNRYPEILERLEADDPDFEIPSGESLRQHYTRNCAAITALAAESRPRRTVLVVHGGVLDSVFRLVAGLSLAAPRCFLGANAGMTVIRYGVFYRTPRWVIDTWNDTAHLE